MPVAMRGKTATLTGVCPIEDAEPLLEWMHANRDGRVQLESCTGMHAAVLIVLMATKPQIAGMPADPILGRWLRSAL